jgi:hypothetical protein
MVSLSSHVTGTNLRDIAAITDVSTFRLYLMRATYLLIAVGLSVEIWPQILNHPMAMHGATSSLLAGMSLLAVVGLRYPLKMLPLLMFELVWKSIWLIAIAYPLWSANQMDADVWDSVTACAMGVVIMPIAIPWAYVWENYVKASGNRWR